jgi:hypothetical protein
MIPLTRHLWIPCSQWVQSRDICCNLVASPRGQQGRAYWFSKWKTKTGTRLTQNYKIEENLKGYTGYQEWRSRPFTMKGHSKAVTNEDHSLFVTGNDLRDTQETWEACHLEGIRDTSVTKELRQAVQELHDLFLTHKDETYCPKQTSQRGRDGWQRTDNLELYYWKRSRSAYL